MTTNSDNTNVANNLAQPKVQDLTEQWKKGELEQGWYYIECIDLPKRWIDIDYYRNDCYEDEGFCKGFFDHNDWRGIDKVLAPVPSYEEWKSTGKFAMEAMKVAEENQQLKELLKECLNDVNHIISKVHLCKELLDLKNKIDNAIGENK